MGWLRRVRSALSAALGQVEREKGGRKRGRKKKTLAQSAASSTARSTRWRSWGQQFGQVNPLAQGGEKRKGREKT